MRIVIDVDLDSLGNVIAVQYISTDRLPDNAVDKPGGGKIDAIDAMATLNGNKLMQGVAGWSTKTKLANAAKGASRWDVFVDAINSGGTDVEKAIGFKH